MMGLGEIDVRLNTADCLFVFVSDSRVLVVAVTVLDRGIGYKYSPRSLVKEIYTINTTSAHRLLLSTDLRLERAASAPISARDLDLSPR